MATTTRKTRYVTAAAAAEYASCSPGTIRKLVSQGDLPAYRLGRAIRIDLDELDRYMALAAGR